MHHAGQTEISSRSLSNSSIFSEIFVSESDVQIVTSVNIQPAAAWLSLALSLALDRGINLNMNSERETGFHSMFHCSFKVLSLQFIKSFLGAYSIIKQFKWPETNSHTVNQELWGPLRVWTPTGNIWFLFTGLMKSWEPLPPVIGPTPPPMTLWNVSNKTNWFLSWTGRLDTVPKQFGHTKKRSFQPCSTASLRRHHSSADGLKMNETIGA